LAGVPEAGKAPAVPTETVRTELSKDDLLKYVELDLWNRFQERLWKIVGVVLTVVTVAGLLGVPYYIRVQVNNTLQQQAKDFENRTGEMLAYSKLIAVLNAQYNSERYRFDGDVYRIVAALREGVTDPSVGLGVGLSSADQLISLVSGEDFQKVTENSYMTTPAFWVPTELRNKKLVPPTTITMENRGPTGSGGGFRQAHPVRDGSYDGCIRDLRYRIVILESLRKAMIVLQEKLLTLGGSSELAKRVELVRIKSIEASDFNESFGKEVDLIANRFLNEKERQEFAQLQEMYTLGFTTNYKAPNVSTDQRGTPTPSPVEQTDAPQEVSTEHPRPRLPAPATPAKRRSIRR
jgi:hypothetical protein